MRMLFSMLMLAAILWSATLVWFVQTMPRASTTAADKTDVIMVLTGGQGRVERGLEMLAEGAAPTLFISGVGEHVTLMEMLAAHATPEIRRKILARQPEIIFDYLADTTQTNADQAAAFVSKRKLSSLRLVTANYHMARSLREFRTAMPTVRMVPDAVFPQGFRRNEWWQHQNTRRLVFSEFYKYFAVRLRDMIL